MYNYTRITNSYITITLYYNSVLKGDIMCKITTIEDNKKVNGIFWRSPFQECLIDFYGFNVVELSLLEKLINFKKLKTAIKEGWEGMAIKTLVFPIYFTRFQRKSVHKFSDHCTLDHIISIGWDPYDNQVGGSAEKEVTTFYYKDNTSVKVVTKNEYKYTYKHVVENEFK